jgi:uncharacterized protein (DUF111 family)
MPQRANVVRAAELIALDSSITSDDVVVLEANMDDMNPQIFSYLFEKLFEVGALDVFVQHVDMKKNRPGFALTVLSKKEQVEDIAQLIFRETSTIGIRFYPAQRLKLIRRLRHLRLGGRKIRVKFVQLPGGATRAVPEYEDCRRLAQEAGRPWQEMFEKIKDKVKTRWPSQD